MEPSVPPPDDGQLRIPIEAKLVPGWRFDASQEVFVSDSGDIVQPKAELPCRNQDRLQSTASDEVRSHGSLSSRTRTPALLADHSAPWKASR